MSTSLYYTTKGAGIQEPSPACSFNKPQAFWNTGAGGGSLGLKGQLDCKRTSPRILTNGKVASGTLESKWPMSTMVLHSPRPNLHSIDGSRVWALLLTYHLSELQASIPHLLQPPNKGSSTVVHTCTSLVSMHYDSSHCAKETQEQAHWNTPGTYHLERLARTPLAHIYFGYTPAQDTKCPGYPWPLGHTLPGHDPLCQVAPCAEHQGTRGSHSLNVSCSVPSMWKDLGLPPPTCVGQSLCETSQEPKAEPCPSSSHTRKVSPARVPQDTLACTHFHFSCPARVSPVPRAMGHLPWPPASLVIT